MQCQSCALAGHRDDIVTELGTRKALPTFDGLGYAFDPERSSPAEPTFVRRP